MIYIPDICGTCRGATKSLKIVYDIYERELAKENPKKIYIYKEILHNPKVIEEFNNLGIETINDLNKVTSEDIVILRAHGEGKDVYDYLMNNNIEFYDATCINVLKIHDLVKEKTNAGYEIILIGKKNHPETIGTIGWANDNIVLVSDESDLANISSNNKKFIIAQTTFNKKKFIDLCNKIKLLYDNSEIEIYNSICNSVERICASSEEVAKKCDLMFVIGGEESSNTEELYNRIKNITESYKFSKIEDFYKFIVENKIDFNKNIGITGGASTPIKEIYNFKYLLSFIIFYKQKLQELKNNQDIINNKLLVEKDNTIVKEFINDFIDLNKDGKYIRGTLIALGEYLANNESKNYLKLAYAYEMLQTSILIHDDIIDNAKERRGKETIPRRICKKYLNLKNNEEYQNDVLKFANSIGICMGDYGFYEANNIIIDNYFANPNLKELLKCFNDIVINTIKGEIIDVSLPFMNKYNFYESKERDILDIYEMKTSIYTIVGPFMLGYILGGKKINEELKSILNQIGIAFQLKDDILGIFADSSIIGKSTISDIEEFKQTILYSYIINTSYKEEFLKIYGKKNLNNKDLEKIKNLLIESGSYEYALEFLNELNYNCLNEIDSLDILGYVKDILKGLIIYIIIREK